MISNDPVALAEAVSERVAQAMADGEPELDLPDETIAKLADLIRPHLYAAEHNGQRVLA